MEINFYALTELIFPYLMASVFVWFYLIYKLIKILEVRHPIIKISDFIKMAFVRRYRAEKPMLVHDRVSLYIFVSFFTSLVWYAIHCFLISNQI